MSKLDSTLDVIYLISMKHFTYGLHLQVEKSFKLDTAFRGIYGPDISPNICVISEYDALPEIGHACGHNLIAEVGVASAVGIMAAIKASNKPLCKVRISCEGNLASFSSRQEFRDGIESCLNGFTMILTTTTIDEDVHNTLYRPYQA